MPQVCKLAPLLPSATDLDWRSYRGSGWRSTRALAGWHRCIFKRAFLCRCDAWRPVEQAVPPPTTPSTTLQSPISAKPQKPRQHEVRSGFSHHGDPEHELHATRYTLPLGPMATNIHDTLASVWHGAERDQSTKSSVPIQHAPKVMDGCGGWLPVLYVAFHVLSFKTQALLSYSPKLMCQLPSAGGGVRPPQLLAPTAGGRGCQ